MVTMAALSFIIGLASQKYPREEKRKASARVFIAGGYRYWELTSRGKRLRAIAIVLMVGAVLLAMYFAGIFT